MNSGKILLGVFLAIYLVVIFIAYFKSKRFFTALLFTALQGICALFAVNLIGKYIAVHIPINSWTLGISSIGGVSGVIMLLLCDIFMSWNIILSYYKTKIISLHKYWIFNRIYCYKLF